MAGGLLTPSNAFAPRNHRAWGEPQTLEEEKSHVHSAHLLYVLLKTIKSLPEYPHKLTAHRNNPTAIRTNGRMSHCEVAPRANHMKETRGKAGAASGEPGSSIRSLLLEAESDDGNFFFWRGRCDTSEGAIFWQHNEKSVRDYFHQLAVRLCQRTLDLLQSWRQAGASPETRYCYSVASCYEAQTRPYAEVEHKFT